MHQHNLDREVARATGEAVATISAMGFSLLALPVPDGFPDHRARVRKIHPRLTSEARKERPRHPSKSSAKPHDRAKHPPAARYYDSGNIIRLFPITRIAFFDKGA